MVRRKPKPDTRPHWNEPIENFKTWFFGRWYNAKEWNEAARQSLNGQQHYKNDPTYDLKVKREKPTT